MTLRFQLGLIIVGGILLFMGFKEFSLASKAKSSPQSITCAELIANGPGDNVNIELKDFLACGNWFIYQTSSQHGGDDGPWETVYMPALPLGGKWHQQLCKLANEDGEIPDGAKIPNPDSNEIKVLIKLKNVRNARHLDNLTDADTLKGMIINSIDSLDGEEKRLLRQGYPGMDTEACYIMEIGRKPGDMGVTIMMLLGGGAMILAGLAWIILGRRKSAAPAFGKAPASAAPPGVVPSKNMDVPSGEPPLTDASPTTPPAPGNPLDKLMKDEKNPYAGDK